MVADGALLGSLLADDDMSAVGALPDYVVVFREHAFLINIVEQLTIALLMLLLNLGYSLELLGNLVEALLTGLLSHTGIHVCPLEVLTIGSSLEVLRSRLDGAAFHSNRGTGTVLLAKD